VLPTSENLDFTCLIERLEQKSEAEQRASLGTTDSNGEERPHGCTSREPRHGHPSPFCNGGHTRCIRL